MHRDRVLVASLANTSTDSSALQISARPFATARDPGRRMRTMEWDWSGAQTPSSYRIIVIQPPINHTWLSATLEYENELRQERAKIGTGWSR